jgi:hypothetical protein
MCMSTDSQQSLADAWRRSGSRTNGFTNGSLAKRFNLCVRLAGTASLLVPFVPGLAAASMETYTFTGTVFENPEVGLSSPSGTLQPYVAIGSTVRGDIQYDPTTAAFSLSFSVNGSQGAVSGTLSNTVVTFDSGNGWNLDGTVFNSSLVPSYSGTALYGATLNGTIAMNVNAPGITFTRYCSSSSCLHSEVVPATLGSATGSQFSGGVAAGDLYIGYSQASELGTSITNGGCYNGNLGVGTSQTSAACIGVKMTSLTSPVPVPAAAWLMLSGLGGLGAMARGRITARAME